MSRNACILYFSTPRQELMVSITFVYDIYRFQILCHRILLHENSHIQQSIRKIVLQMGKIKIVDNFSPKMYNKMENALQNNSFWSILKNSKTIFLSTRMCIRKGSVNFLDKITLQYHFSKQFSPSNYNGFFPLL